MPSQPAQDAAAPSPPRCPRFQIHLSTAIVLMFAAGLLIWANTHERERRDFLGRFGDSNTPIDWEVGYSSRCLTCQYGWPYPAVYFGAYLRPDGSFIKGMPNTITGKSQYLIPDYHTVIWDVAIALAILFAVWFVLEWLIRRRAARKGE